MGIRIAESGSVGLKALIVAVIVLVLLIPLSMLRGLVSERSGLREAAYLRVAEGWGGDIVGGGPMLIVPTERVVTERSATEGTTTRIARQDLYLLPAQLDVDVDLTMQPEPRKVGIYAVPVYLATVRVTGRFEIDPQAVADGGADRNYLWNHSRLRLPLSQVRSLRDVQQARFADTDLRLGPAAPGVYGGVEARVDLSQILRGEPVEFAFTTVVAGSRAFSILPLGSTTNVTLKSNWPHPSFQGGFLPAEHNIDARGFDARWQVLELNRPYRQSWLEGEVDAAMLDQSALNVGLYQAVDVYQRGERAVKYALLFIALTFLTFFAWEQISRLRLHPLQYLLVGLALSTFYLLLIALSEHIAFAPAYLVAAVALVVLIGVYIAGALHSRGRGLIAAAAMTIVYGLLYVLVLSEDYALLLGAIILFAALAATMLATRHVNWHRLNESAGTPDTAAANR